MFVVILRRLAPFVAGAAAYQLAAWLFEELDHVHDHQHAAEEGFNALDRRVTSLENNVPLVAHPTIEEEAKVV